MVLLLTAAAALVGAVAVATPAQAVGPYYHIVNFNSGKCLQPQSSAFNALIEQRSCGSSQSQNWEKNTYPGTAYVYYVNQWSGLCLDIQVNSLDDIVPGVPAQQFGCAPSPETAELWGNSPVRSGGYVQIWSQARSSMCLDIRNNSTSNGALAVMGSCWTGDVGQAFKYVLQ